MERTKYLLYGLWVSWLRARHQKLSKYFMIIFEQYRQTKPITGQHWKKKNPHVSAVGNNADTNTVAVKKSPLQNGRRPFIWKSSALKANQFKKDFELGLNSYLLSKHCFYQKSAFSKSRILRPKYLTFDKESVQNINKIETSTRNTFGRSSPYRNNIKCVLQNIIY